MENLPHGFRRVETTEELWRWDKFDPDKLINNEIRNGDSYLAKIPKIKGRITRKETEHGTYIQFIHDRMYDPVKKQNRNRKTIIGTSTEPMIPGMMLVNHNYYKFFDHDGKLKYKPVKTMPEEESDNPEDLAMEEVEYEPCEPEEEEKAPAGEENGSMKEDTRTGSPPGDKPARDDVKDPDAGSASREAKASSGQPAGEPDKAKTPAEAGADAPPAETKRTVPPFQSDEDSIPYTKRQLLDAYMELKKQYEDLEMRCLFESEKARDDHIHYLRQNLIDFEHAVEPLAKKKPDTPMSRRQIQQIEALLRELRDLFHGAEGDEYLLPAEEAPDGAAAHPNENSEETRPTTYGEMQLILAPYGNILHEYDMHRLWKKMES